MKSDLWKTDSPSHLSLQWKLCFSFCCFSLLCHQDLYVAHLTKDLERLSQQVHMYEAQKTAQAEETKAAKQAFSEVTVSLFSEQ